MRDFNALAFTLRDFSLRENHLAGYPSFLTEEHNKMLNSSFRCTTLTPIEQSSTVFNTDIMFNKIKVLK
jgi:hypothetical protein